MKVTYEANASYVNVGLAADVLYMGVNTLVFSKFRIVGFAVVDNDMTLCPTEMKVQLEVSVHLSRCIRRHFVLSMFIYS